MNNQGVSILLAVYNGERYIEKSIESVLNQTYKNFELIIGFNGTIDNSKKIVDKFKDNRILIFDFGSDKGKAKTLNRLLPVCKFDWVAIQDDDDIWMPKKLEKQIELSNDYDVIGTTCQYINESDEYIGHPNLSSVHEEILNRSLNGDNQIINTSAIFKKQKALEVKGWAEDIDGIEDYDFWLKLMKSGCKFHNINKILMCHRIHNKSNFNTRSFDIKGLIDKYKD